MGDKHLKNLADEILKLRTKKQIEEFLTALLTPEELNMIPRRIEIVRLLKKRMPQRSIAKLLGVGIATVTRGARELQANRFENIA